MACRAVILSKDNGQVELNKNQLAAAVVVAKYFPELGARICSARREFTKHLQSLNVKDSALKARQEQHSSIKQITQGAQFEK